MVSPRDTGQTRFFVGWHPQLFELRRWDSRQEAIVFATRGADRESEHWMIANGRSADFVVLDANPLDDIANSRRINKVFLRGQEVDRARLRAKWTAEWNRKSQ